MAKTVREIFGMGKTEGEVGIEIEMEGSRLPISVSTYWQCKMDGSLRGESMEYVLTRPIERKEVVPALAVLNDRFVATKSSLKPSPRCGVHVHLNVQKYTLDDLTNFLTLWFILEELMVKYCGELREGNMFCLRGSDATYLVNAIVLARRTGDWMTLARLPVRYSAMNVVAIGQYGSLEVRCAPTTPDMSDVATWVELLLCIRDKAREFDSPSAMVESFSGVNARTFLNMIFGDKAELLYCDEMDELLMEGIRLIQDLAYAVPTELDTDKYKEMEDQYVTQRVDESVRAQAILSQVGLANARQFETIPGMAQYGVGETVADIREIMARTKSLFSADTIQAFRYNTLMDQRGALLDGEYMITGRTLYKFVRGSYNHDLPAREMSGPIVWYSTEIMYATHLRSNEQWLAAVRKEFNQKKMPRSKEWDRLVNGRNAAEPRGGLGGQSAPLFIDDEDNNGDDDE